MPRGGWGNSPVVQGGGLNYSKSRPFSTEPWPRSAWANWGRHPRVKDEVDSRSNSSNSWNWVNNSQSGAFRPRWSDRHYVADSNINRHAHQSKRRYFDDLPKFNLQGKPKIRPSSAVHSARCQASAYFQRNAWEWKKLELQAEEEERKASRPEASNKPDEETEEFKFTPDNQRKSLFQGVDGRKSLAGEHNLELSAAEQKKRSLARRMSTKTLEYNMNSPEGRKLILESQIMMMYEKTATNPDLEPVADFYFWCIEKFNNLTRCWRSLDQSLNMRLSYLEFLTSLRKYEFTGDSRLIFKILDRDRSGALTYYHFDQNGAVELARLKSWATEKFGGVAAAFQELDTDKNGSITLEEFNEGAKIHGLHNDEPIPHVFEMLDLDHDAKVVPSELGFLDAWDCPAWLMCEPDFKGAQQLKARLMSKHKGNIIIAWHYALDFNHMMRVSWAEFVEAGKRENIVKERLPGIWRALDTDLSGWLSLKELDPAVHELLVKFKKYCTTYGGAQQGSIRTALAIIDKTDHFAVSIKEFSRMIKAMGLNEAEIEILFNGLDLTGEGVITPHKIAYLDKWSVEADSLEDLFWDVVAQCLKAKHKGERPREIDLSPADPSANPPKKSSSPEKES